MLQNVEVQQTARGFFDNLPSISMYAPAPGGVHERLASGSDCDCGDCHCDCNDDCNDHCDCCDCGPGDED